MDDNSSFDDDFSPLQGSTCSATGGRPHPKVEDCDVPALRLSPTEALSSPGSDVSVGNEEKDSAGSSSSYIRTRPPREDPEVIVKWKEQQVKNLLEKDAAEEEAKLQLREQAKMELENWYKQHAEQLTKLQSANRSASETAEREFRSTTHEISPGTEWERVAKLCDFNPKTARNVKDVGRMRSVILQLKQSGNNGHSASNGSGHGLTVASLMSSSATSNNGDGVLGM